MPPPGSSVSTASNSKRHGIVVAGSWSVEVIATVPAPPSGAAQRRTIGHAAVVAKTMARLGAGFPLAAVGLIGDDADGAYVAADCRVHHIDTTQLRIDRGGAPPAAAHRTATDSDLPAAFSTRTAAERLSLAHFDLTTTNAKILHVGCPAELPQLDIRDAVGRTRWQELGVRARTAGIRWSLALPTDRAKAWRPIVAPLLGWLDYLFLTSEAASELTDTKLQLKAGLSVAAVEDAARQLLEAGVARWVIIHHPRAVFALNPGGFAVWQPTVVLPPGVVPDPAAAAAVLLGGILFPLHDHWPMDEALKIGVVAAAASIACARGVDDLPPLEKCVALAKQHGFHPAVTRARGFV